MIDRKLAKFKRSKTKIVAPDVLNESLMRMREDSKFQTSTRVQSKDLIVSGSRVRLEVLGYEFTTKEIKIFNKKLQDKTTIDIFK